jgi:hypothetical protein
MSIRGVMATLAALAALVLGAVWTAPSYAALIEVDEDMRLVDVRIDPLVPSPDRPMPASVATTGAGEAGHMRATQSTLAPVAPARPDARAGEATGPDAARSSADTDTLGLDSRETTGALGRGAGGATQTAAPPEDPLPSGPRFADHGMSLPDTDALTSAESTYGVTSAGTSYRLRAIPDRDPAPAEPVGSMTAAEDPAPQRLTSAAVARAIGIGDAAPAARRSAAPRRIIHVDDTFAYHALRPTDSRSEAFHDDGGPWSPVTLARFLPAPRLSMPHRSRTPRIAAIVDT